MVCMVQLYRHWIGHVGKGLMKKRLAEKFEHDVIFEEEEAIDDSYTMKEDWIRIENIYVQKQSITA